MNKKFDDYIQKSADFAKPILKHFRSLVHKADPDIEETIKWGMPFFDHKGTVCHMAAFKQHCAIGFWKGSLMKDSKKVFVRNEEAAMGHLGRITSLKDLPSDKILIEYIKEAVKLNEAGIKLPPKKPKEKKELEIPDYLTTALKKNKKAQKTFEDFSYTNKKEYIDWLTEAKTEATRNKRLETAIEWISEGKIRNWMYVK
ncbi:MAG: YdeI/OmpD-associated family protein [Ignavibacteriaceae bacterium]